MDGVAAQASDGQRVLEFAAEHPFVLLKHVMELLGADENAARELVGALGGRGCLRRDRVFAGGSDWFRITGRGLTEIGSELPAPAVDWGPWRHDAGVVWIWLAGMKGGFGEMIEVLSERRMRARDRSGDGFGVDGGSAYGVVADVGGGRRELRYPEVMLVAGFGRIAVFLADAPLRAAALEPVIAALAGEPLLRVILFLVTDARIGLQVQAVVARLGLSELVQIQPARLGSYI